MDGNLINVKALINKVLFKLILINTGYECYSIMDKDFVTELWLPRVKILPKLITGFVKENTERTWVEITEITKFSIDIQGYRQNIFTYIIPVLLNPVIMGLPWMKEVNIIIRLVTNTLIVNFYSLIILTKEIPVLLKIKELIIMPFVILIKRARKRKKTLTVFKALLQDITKVLRLKII